MWFSFKEIKLHSQNNIKPHLQVLQMQNNEVINWPHVHPNVGQNGGY